MDNLSNTSQNSEENFNPWLIYYLALAFGISTLAYYSNYLIEPQIVLRRLLTFITKFGPSLAGILIVYLLYGKVGIRNLFRKTLNISLDGKHYLWALLFPLAVVFLAVAVLSLFIPLKITEQGFSQIVGTYFLFQLRFFFIGGGLGEELGWRGFMLPYLVKKMDPIKAACWVGIAHGFWHLPAYGLLTIAFIPMSMAMSIILAHLFFQSSANLLLMALMHASLNTSVSLIGSIFPDLQGNMYLLLIVMLIWICVAILLALKWKNKLNRDETYRSYNLDKLYAKSWFTQI